jgi:asparagine synthase (glutamine-hydrolysing)
MVQSPYGFAVVARFTEMRVPLDVTVNHEHGVSRAIAPGLAMLTRHHKSTPEAKRELQPIVSPAVVLVYEGRVDNREDVAYALGRPELILAPDGEVLAAAYEAWGERLAAKVIGEFAFAALDRRENRLVASQDALRVRRVYYRIQNDCLCITSNLAFLFEQFPDARTSIDQAALLEYFSGFMTPWSGRTIWSGFRELGQGNALVRTATATEEQVVWRPLERVEWRNRSDAEVDAEFRRLLFTGVRSGMRSSGALLCDLSGGYDSSTVCSIAASLSRAAGDRGAVIAWSYFNGRTEERKFQDAVRAEYDLDMHVLDIREHLPFKTFSDTEIPSLGFVQFGAIDAAMGDIAQRCGTTARLTGYAADALFNKGITAPIYLSEWLREGRIQDWLRDFRAYLQSGSFSAWHLLCDCTWGSLDMRAGTFRTPPPDWLLPKFVSGLMDAEQAFLCRADRIFESTARERMFRMTVAFVPPHGRILPDERMPLIYRPLVEFMLSLDWRHLARPNETRVLMRRSLRGILPEPVREDGAKTVHAAPILEGLRASWPQVGPLLTGEMLGDLGVLEPKLFRAAVERMRGGFAGLNRQYLNTAVYLELWLRLKSEGLLARGGAHYDESPLGRARAS